MPADGVEHGSGFLAVFADELHADGGMAAFHSGGVIHRLADVVEKAAAAGQRAVESQLICDDLTDVGDFDGVSQDVLAVTGAEVEFAHGFDDLGMQAADVCFDDRFIACFGDSFGHVLADLLDDFLTREGCTRPSATSLPRSLAMSRLRRVRYASSVMPRSSAICFCDTPFIQRFRSR